MSASNSQNIQTLLKVEKEAALMVEKARQYRVQRLKEARTEAKKEIEEKAEAFKKELASIVQNSEDMKQLEDDINAKSEKRIQEINALYETNKDAAVNKL
ncbi:hypothetical protein EV182_002356, partial [Spiromyces aspiralis]